MKQILKQTSWLIIAQLLTKVIGFFYTIFLAKSLGVEDFGLYTVAFAYFSILSAVADFGFNRFLIREIALGRMNSHQLLWNTMILRITISSVLFAVFAITLYLTDSDSFRVNLILLSTLAILPQTIGLTFDGIFIAMKKLQFSSFILFISTIAMSFLGYLLLNSGFGVVGAINALIFGQLVYASAAFILIGFTQGLHSLKIELPILKEAIVGSLPYGLLGILGLLYFRIDSIILSYLKGSFETGIYGAAYRFLETIIFIPSAFAAALFPSMAQLQTQQNKTQLKSLYFKSVKLMAFLGIIFLAGYFFILPEIIKKYLPNYILAIDAIKILSLSIPFIFIATPGVQVLLSTEKYLKSVLFFSVLTLFLNVMLNLIFIPQFGYIAASWITVFSDITSFIIFFLMINFYIFTPLSGASKKS